MEMFGRMFIFRRIAAPDMSAGQTNAQMHPAIADFQTILTALGAGCNFVNLVKMGTGLGHTFHRLVVNFRKIFLVMIKGEV